MGTYSKEQDLTSLLKKKEVPEEIIKQISAVGWTDAVEFAAGLDRDQLHDPFLVGTKFDSTTHRAGTPQVRLGPASRGSPLYVCVRPSAGVRTSGVPSTLLATSRSSGFRGPVSLECPPF